MTQDWRGLVLRSCITAAGELRVAVTEEAAGMPGTNEVVVRVEAAPINPTDMGLLFGPADLAAARLEGTARQPVLVAPVPPAAMSFVALRIDQPLPAGVEGAGVVVAAGSGQEALLGKTVAMMGDGAYAQYRRIAVADILVLPDGTSPADGAAALVNPLTVLGMLETAQRNGHKAIVHTAAASSVGKMLIRACRQDGVPLVNIVRRDDQVAELRAMGAEHVCNSAAPEFRQDLARALADTNATACFDAVGGALTGRILGAMEAAASQHATQYSRYGTNVLKQAFVYGALDRAPIEISRIVGLNWSVAGWLLFDFLQQADAATRARLRQRVCDELHTTFAASYAATISLAAAVQPQTVMAYMEKRSGVKYLINPQL
ncbi:zinc-binding dehydrogenase [Ferrovibrio sp.]|jgi:NADPH2:quinone reductase|uniref:zinc-binding dehydrogenase n=1 Tax=Ferrovibrio sp. TaxID=1917215 RepID=UPI0035142F37